MELTLMFFVFVTMQTKNRLKGDYNMEELTQVIDEQGTVLTYSDENGQYQLSKSLANTTDKINKLQLNMKKSLLAIAKILSDIKSEDVKKAGFKNVAHYAGVVFGYKKAMTSNLIRIGTQYVIHDKNKYYTILENDGSDFTVSQLQECLKLDVATVQDLVEEKTITADMTCKEIRDVVKELTTETVEKEETEETEETEENFIETEETEENFIESFEKSIEKFKKDCDIFIKECEKIEKDNQEFLEKYNRFFCDCTVFFKNKKEEFYKYTDGLQC